MTRTMIQRRCARVVSVFLFHKRVHKLEKEEEAGDTYIESSSNRRAIYS